MKSNKTKGITLIALVVTIVVLLILAGITLTIVFGENGIINQANKAKEAEKIGKYKDLFEIAKMTVYTKNQGSVTVDQFVDELLEEGVITDKETQVKPGSEEGSVIITPEPGIDIEVKPLPGGNNIEIKYPEPTGKLPGGNGGGSGSDGGTEEPTIVKAENIAFSSSNPQEVEIGKTINLQVTFTPSNTTNKGLTWTSSSEDVATVNNGVVTGIKAGTATITATTTDGSNKTASCTVTVKLTTISKETSYVGCYADMDGNGSVDGIIYADLAIGGSGQWETEDGAYTIPKVETGLKEYYVSQASYTNDFGTSQVIAPVKGSSGTDRFYIMALEDVQLKNPYSETSNTAYWYYNANLKMTDYATYTSSSFGSGKENTQKMITKWKAKGYGEQNEKDLWGQIDSEISKGWFVPSKEEWAVFGQKLGITNSNYQDYKLGEWYWSSSQCNSNSAWSALFDTGYIFNTFVTRFDYVRLSATF